MFCSDYIKYFFILSEFSSIPRDQASNDGFFVTNLFWCFSSANRNDSFIWSFTFIKNCFASTPLRYALDINTSLVDDNTESVPQLIALITSCVKITKELRGINKTGNDDGVVDCCSMFRLGVFGPWRYFKVLLLIVVSQVVSNYWEISNKWED